MKYKDQLRIEDTFKNAELNSAWAFAAAALASVWTKPSLTLATIAIAFAVLSSCLNVYIWRKGKCPHIIDSVLFCVFILISAPYRGETRSWTAIGQMLFCLFLWSGVAGLVYSYSRKMVLSSLGFRDKRCPQTE